MNATHRVPSQGWNLPGFTKSTILEILEYMVSTTTSNAVQWILQIFNHTSKQKPTPFNATNAYENYNCPWGRVTTFVKSERNIKHLLRDWHWSENFKEPWLAPELAYVSRPTGRLVMTTFLEKERQALAIKRLFPAAAVCRVRHCISSHERSWLQVRMDFFSLDRK